MRVSIMFQFQRTMATNVCIKNVPITEDKATKGYVMIIFVDQLNIRKYTTNLGKQFDRAIFYSCSAQVICSTVLLKLLCENLHPQI